MGGLEHYLSVPSGGQLSPQVREGSPGAGGSLTPLLQQMAFALCLGQVQAQEGFVHVFPWQPITCSLLRARSVRGLLQVLCPVLQPWQASLSVPQVLSLPLIFLSVTQWKPTEKFCTVRSYLAFNDSLQLWWFSYQPLWLPSPKEKQFMSFLSLEELVTLWNSFQLVGHCICKIERPQVSDELKKLI